MENNHLSHFFDKIIFSEKVGFSKPDKEIFKLAAEQIGTPPSDCIYVGNSYNLDYIGSLNAWMNAIWLDRENSKANCKCEKIRL